MCMKKIVIVGSNCIHTKKYISMISDYFEEIYFLTNKPDGLSGIIFKCVSFSLNISGLLSVITIRKYLKEIQPSVVHIHQANSYAFITMLALIGTTYPVVLSAWGSDVLVNPKRSVIFKWMLKWILKHSSIVTSDSLYMSSEVKQYCQSVSTIEASFGISSESKNEFEKENIIYSNRNHELLYNVDKIIFAFAKFSENHDNWKFVIASSGSETTRLKQLVVSLGIKDKVEFIGWVSQEKNNELYQKSSIFVSIPSSDATSISLLEAISQNCICVVSNLPANTEHILHGINGLIVQDIDNMDFEQYIDIDVPLLEKVNMRRSETYTVDYNKNIFLSIYKSLLMNKTGSF